MDKTGAQDNGNGPSKITNDFSALTFGSVLSALSNGSPRGLESSSSSLSPIIADRTLQLESRLRLAEAEIATLKNVNQLQKDRIDSLENELDSARDGEKKCSGTTKTNSRLDRISNNPSSSIINSPAEKPLINRDSRSMQQSSVSPNSHFDDFTRDLQSYYETRCRNLEKMVLEMHRWFSDYDLVWVGEKEGDEAQALKELTDEQFEEFEARNAYLNLETLVNAFPNGDDEENLFYDDDDSTPSLDLFWFANGLKISSYPLMRYDDETWGRQTLEEIAEGFLPSRLQFDFPNGVDLKSRDRRRFVFDDTKEKDYPSVRELRARGLLPSTDHPGLEDMMGKNGRISSNKDGGKDDFKPSVWSFGSRVRQKSPASRYLEKVPKVVIDKDGDIRRPREGLQRMLAGHSEESTKNLGSRSVIPVRIRVYHRHDDKQVLRVHLQPHQTIEELKRICEKKLNVGENSFDEFYQLVSDAEMRKYEMSESELVSSSLKVWDGEKTTVGDAGWLRSGVEEDAPIKDKLVCLHIRQK